ncbi:MAG TPA: hypothetical protein VLS89_18160, partial [Candidatus Nanopelagicales bacterium]|nr:hypothetical protein [Candidatus Nanopelagicales bacterium]
MVTFGGYASYTTGRAIWGGYKEFGILGALNALNPLYHLAKSAADTFMAADRGDWEAVGQGGVKTGVAALGAAGAVVGIAGVVRGAVAGAKGAAAGAATSGAPSIAKGSQVTEQSIRETMKDAPLSSQQAGGVSLPTVQRYVDKLLSGEVAPPIKVDGRMIVDGNHRYIAGRILGQEPAIQPWAGG